MADVELLNAIERMLDVKLDEKLAPIHAKLDSLDQRVSRLEERVTCVEERLTHLEEKVSHLEESVTGMDKRVRKVELLMESVVLPRIRSIEACYMSTFERYKKYCEKMEQVMQDVEILKITVHEHSLRLKLTS